MPTILIGGYKFRFYAQDIGEPPHIHAIKGENEAKIWLSPVDVQYNHGYNERELSRILTLAREHQGELLEVWHGYFGSG